MKGFIIIIGFDGLGWLLHEGAGVPLPSHVLGLLLLTLALFTRLIKLEWVESAATLLTRHMMLFFVPLLAGVSVFIPMLSEAWPVIAVSIIAGTSAVTLLSGLVMRLLVDRKKGVKPAHEQQHSVF
ncbi:CidA/LrgA family protein [Paenibacillus mendelii]|uniref:CidA/LrgA family protein n=1 Tax=Paenibacillus mendelii TaxID=206163 RepID=A0ABV6JH08_9BACL|nr:CidA/LrgA family protein [Paenibacillus mendelii]MCQ6557967.1 CidA/LrgA family protein [Paenibacillus mendelii]